MGTGSFLPERFAFGIGLPNVCPFGAGINQSLLCFLYSIDVHGSGIGGFMKNHKTFDIRNPITEKLYQNSYSLVGMVSVSIMARLDNLQSSTPENRLRVGLHGYSLRPKATALHERWIVQPVRCNRE